MWLSFCLCLVATQTITYASHCYIGFRALSSPPFLHPFTCIKRRRDQEEAGAELVCITWQGWRPLGKTIQNRQIFLQLIYTVYFHLK